MQSRQTDVKFTAAAPLRAWLANNLGLNPFFNGDTRSVRMPPAHTPAVACVYVRASFALHVALPVACGRRWLHLRRLLRDEPGV